jgi:hypothetical protein
MPIRVDMVNATMLTQILLAIAARVVKVSLRLHR